MRQDGEGGGCRTVRGLACFGGVSQRVLTALVEYWTRRPVRFWVESELRYPELFQGACRKNVPVEAGQLRALLALLQNAGVDPQPITEENDGRERMRL